jgi:hypothetical protein
MTILKVVGYFKIICFICDLINLVFILQNIFKNHFVCQNIFQLVFTFIIKFFYFKISFKQSDNYQVKSFEYYVFPFALVNHNKSWKKTYFIFVKLFISFDEFHL